MYNSFVSAKAMSYKKIQYLCLGFTYTRGFRGKGTYYYYYYNYCYNTTHNCYNVTVTMDY